MKSPEKTVFEAILAIAALFALALLPLAARAESHRQVIEAVVDLDEPYRETVLQAARRHVSGNQDRQLTFLEFSQQALTFLLRHIT